MIERSLPLLGIHEIEAVGGQVILHEKFATRLTHGETESVVVVPGEKCLSLFPASLVRESRTELPDSFRNPEVFETELHEGILNIPTNLRHLVPDGTVMAVGLGDHLELWSREEYAKVTNGF